LLVFGLLAAEDSCGMFSFCRLVFITNIIKMQIVLKYIQEILKKYLKSMSKKYRKNTKKKKNFLI